jgi:hypothetical protein
VCVAWNLKEIYAPLRIVDMFKQPSYLRLLLKVYVLFHTAVLGYTTALFKVVRQTFHKLQQIVADIE